MQNSTSVPTMDYRREIDGLRAVAVLPVIFFHAGFQLFSGGFVGVDVFFVLSGYLITSIILADKQAGTFSFLRFYERRARRILPALFAVMAVCLPFAWVYLAPNDLKGFAQSLSAVCTFSSNFLFWGQSGYFDTTAELKPLLHTWSLAVEEQYYLLFPLFMHWTWRFGRLRQTWILVVIAAVSFIAAQAGTIYAPGAAFFLLPSRAWELLVGALTAFYLMKDKAHAARIPTSAGWLSLVGLFLILASVFAFDRNTPFPGVYALPSVLGTALVILFAGPDTYVGRILGCRVLVGMGLISYSAYLWHQAIFAFTRHIYRMEPPWQQLLLLSALTIFLAWLSWKYVETPFRKKGGLSRKTVFTFAFCGSLVFVALGQAGDQSNGFIQSRLTPGQAKLMETAAGRPEVAACRTRGMFYTKPAEACEFFGADVTWAIMGDSHTQQLAYVLANRLKPHGLGIKQLTFIGCAPSYGRTGPDSACSSWTAESVDYLIQKPAIGTVVVTYRLTEYLFGQHEETYPELPNKVPESERVAAWKSLVDMLAKLQSAGKRVIFVVQPPEISKPMGDLIFRMAPETREIIGVSRDWWNKRNQYVQSMLGTIPKGVIVIDPTNFFCDDKQCYATKNGESLYIDDDHVSIPGANINADAIMKAIRNKY